MCDEIGVEYSYDGKIFRISAPGSVAVNRGRFLGRCLSEFVSGYVETGRGDGSTGWNRSVVDHGLGQTITWEVPTGRYASMGREGQGEGMSISGSAAVDPRCCDDGGSRSMADGRNDVDTADTRGKCSGSVLSENLVNETKKKKEEKPVGVQRGPNGGISYGRGGNYERNCRNRVARRVRAKSNGGHAHERLLKTQMDLKDPELQRQELELKRSSALKWKAQNELATEKARRELHVLQQNDVQGEIQRYRTKVSAATERNMVSIEKTHGLLKSTGNVPEFHGSVETVVDGEIVSSNTPELTSGSISPDSSISQAEARKAQKDLLDAQGEIENLKGKLALITRKAGFSAEHFELYDKNTWTENDENEALLDELYPEGYVVNREYCAVGKFQLR